MKYDLLKEPWILVRDKQNAIHEVGILELLEKSPEFIEIIDAYPNQEFGIYRMLMTLLMDIYKPENTEVLEDMLEDGQFNMNKINDYLNDCQADGNRFDLFDEIFLIISFIH